MVLIEKHCWTRWRQALRSISERRSRARTAWLTLLTRNPVCPSLITSRHEPRSMAITGTPAALASARTSPNRSGMVFRWIKAQARANNSFFFRYAHRPDIADFLIIDVRFEPFPIIDFILDDASDDQTPAAQARDLDGQMDTLIRVNPAKEEEVLTARGLQRVQRE